MDHNKIYNPTYINGQPYAVMLPTGGTKEGEPSQWDDVVSMLGDHADRLHYDQMPSFCIDDVAGRPQLHPSRGGNSADHWDWFHQATQFSSIGYRPILVPLDPETMQPNASAFSSYKDGSTFLMGTLYMDDQPVHNPTKPIWYGDIQNYRSGASLHIGNSDLDPANQIQWIKCGDFLIADRNLLKGISWDDLNKQGLVYGREQPEMVKGPTQKDGPNHSEELFLPLAFLAGKMEAEKQIDVYEWAPLSKAIHEMIDAYLNDPNESKNPFALEDASELYFLTQFGTEEYKEGLSLDLTPSELVAQAKQSYRRAPEKVQTMQIEKPKNPFETIDYNLLYAQKMALLSSMERGGYLPNEAAEGLVNLLDAIGDYGEEKGLFTYPRSEEEVLNDPEAVMEPQADKLLIVDQNDGHVFVWEAEGVEDVLEEMGGKLFGVYTQPECPAFVYNGRSQEGASGQIDEKLLYQLQFGKVYDVCYTEKQANGVKTEMADLHQTAGDVFVHLASGRYAEGARIFERKNMLTSDEYAAGMRLNQRNAKKQLSQEQRHEVALAEDDGVPIYQMLRPELSLEEIHQLRIDLTVKTFEANNIPYEFTEDGPEELMPCFYSVSNFTDHPDRVCYVPEDWDFEENGRGYTAKDIIELCDGDAVKARMVFGMCDWQHPSTVLYEWDEDDEKALQEEKSKLAQLKTAFSDLIKDAQNRASNQNTGKETEPER